MFPTWNEGRVTAGDGCALSFPYACALEKEAGDPSPPVTNGILTLGKGDHWHTYPLDLGRGQRGGSKVAFEGKFRSSAGLMAKASGGSKTDVDVRSSKFRVDAQFR